MKRKLLVLLGAGSSVEQGFPTTNRLNCEVAKWAHEHAAIKQSPDYYGLLWQNRADYCAGLPSEMKEIFEHRTAPNYERVMGDLHALMNGVLGKPFGDPILKWITKADAFNNLGIEPDVAEREANSGNKNFYAVQGQLKTLCDGLANRIRGGSRLFETERLNGRGIGAFKPYKQFFASLSQEFELGVYNLNYDTVALNALPNAFVGFDKQTGHFLPAEIFSRPTWGKFLYHLHGSVHHRMRSGSRVMEHKDFGSKIIWHNDLSQRGDNEDWEDSAELGTQSDEKRVLLTSLVAGGWKLDQLQEEPFLTFYSCLPRHVHEADAILIAGYGFGDSHINSILKNSLRSKANGLGRPPVLVIDYEQARQRTVKRAAPWPIAIRNSLRVTPQCFRDPEYRSETNWLNLPDQVSLDEFEQSTELDKPVAIWNGGFISAAKKSAQIVKWLNGDQSAI